MHKLTIFLIFFILTGCGGGSTGGSTGGDNPSGVSPSVTVFEVITTYVPNGSMAVDPRTAFYVEFNANFGASGVNSDQVLLTDGKNNYPVTITTSGGTIKVTPVANLHTSTEYQLVIKSGVSSSNGTVLKNDYVLKFKTVLAMFENKQLAPADITVSGGYKMPRIIISDVNSDGRPDLIELAGLYRPDLFAANGYTLNVYLQNTNGGFDKFQKLEHVADQSASAKYFNNLIVLDIDGDNKPELLVPEYRPDDEANTGIRVFKSGIDGKFIAHEFILTNYTETLQTLDVDGDGKIDLVGSNRRAIDQVTGGFQVLRNMTTGLAILPPVLLKNGGYEFGIGDLDGDGKRELILNRLFSKPSVFTLTTELLIFSQGSAGMFSLNSVLTSEAIDFCANSSYCKDMKVADLNGDGKSELVFNSQTTVAEGADNLVIGYSRQAESRFVKIFQISIGSNTSVYEVRDMDGDGVPDLFVVASTGFFSIVGGNTNFSWAFSNRLNNPVFDTMYPENIAIGDIDGDGKPDIIFDSYNSGIVMARQVKY